MLPSRLNRLLALLIISLMSCSATAQAPSNVQSLTPVLIPVQQQVTVGVLLGNLDTTEQVYYYVTNDGPVLAGVNNTIPDDVDWDENVLSCFERLGINGLGSTLFSSAAELPTDAQLLRQMDPSFTITWTLFQNADNATNKRDVLVNFNNYCDSACACNVGHKMSSDRLCINPPNNQGKWEGLQVQVAEQTYVKIFRHHWCRIITPGDKNKLYPTTRSVPAGMSTTCIGDAQSGCNVPTRSVPCNHDKTSA